MPSNIEPRWVKAIVFHLLGGGIIGKLISLLLKVFLTNPKWTLFLQIWVPLGAIVGLLIVLRNYQKEKDDTSTL